VSEHDNHRPDELLSRAIESLRQDSNNAEPSAEAIARTISATSHAATGVKPTLTARFFDMPWKYKAVMATGTLAATVVLALTLLVPSSKSLALGQVVEKLRAAQRISFRVEQRSANPARAFKTRVWLMEPDKSRIEWSMPQGRSVMVRNGDKNVRLDPTKKTAVVGQFPRGELGSEREALDQLRSVVEKEARSLGEKVMDGVRAKGFEAVIHGRKITLWANVENGNLIRIEYPLTEIPPPAGPGLSVLSDFKFDEPFDPQLFSLEVPPGYEVSQFESIPVGLLKDHMVAILRFYSQQTGGKFPTHVDDQGRAIAEQLGLPQERDAMTAEQKQLMVDVDGMALYLKAGQAGRHFEYYPGVKFGDKDRVVFWHVESLFRATFTPLIPRPDAGPPPKPPEEKYLAIYGDLRVEELKKDQLPPPRSDR